MKEERKDASAAEQSWTDALIESADEHLGLVASVLLAGLVLLRVGQVSRYNPATTVGVVGSLGPVDVALGVIAAELPLLLAVAIFLVGAPLLAASRGWQEDLDSLHGPTVVRFFVLKFSPLLMLLLISVAGVPLKYLVILVPVTLYFGLRRYKGEGGGPLRALVDARFLLMVAAALLISDLIFTNKVWLPRERMMIGNSAFDGYVLQDDGEWMTLLSEGDRIVILALSSDVTAREVCQERNVWDRPLFAYGEMPVDPYPRCPSNDSAPAPPPTSGESSESATP